MLRKSAILFLFAGVFTTTPFCIAQEPSADISNEVNTDAFQEHFYESLKQKGIENYDKAINALLECKKLDPDNHVIDYELGLNYMYQKQYIEAQSYLEAAISKQPDNKWYLDALLKCYKAQHNTEKATSLAEKLAKNNPEYYNALAILYVEQQTYDKALNALDKMASVVGNTAEIKLKKAKINLLKNINTLNTVQNNGVEDTPVDNPVEDYKKQILIQQQKAEYAKMLVISSEAVDNYPTHPEFYYLKGVALNKLQRFEISVSVLEEGLDYIIDDNTLQNNIYGELVFAYKGLNNPKKASEYQQKMNTNN